MNPTTSLKFVYRFNRESQNLFHVSRKFSHQRLVAIILRHTKGEKIEIK